MHESDVMALDCQKFVEVICAMRRQVCVAMTQRHGDIHLAQLSGGSFSRVTRKVYNDTLQKRRAKLSLGFPLCLTLPSATSQNFAPMIMRPHPKAYSNSDILDPEAKTQVYQAIDHVLAIRYVSQRRNELCSDPPKVNRGKQKSRETILKPR